MFSNDQIFYHEPIFHQGFTNVQYKESHQQLSFLKEQMLLKEQELLKKDEKILKLKMKLKKQKSSAKTNQEIEKGLSEYKKSLPQLPPISIPVEPFLVYRENDSEVLLLRDSLATSHNEIEILKKTIESNEKVSLNKLQDIELSYKAQMIMKEEEFIKFEVFFTKESELFQMKIKEIQEKYLISEVHLSKLHIKKKNLKRLYKESLKNIDKIQIELREYYEEQLDNLRHNISMVENEMKGVLERNNELEENLKDFNNEKNIILNNLNLEKEDNKLWHLKYEECLLKIKELQASKKDMKQFSLKNMEGYYENMLEIMQKFTMNYREKRDKISDKIVKEVHHHIPQAQQSYVPQVQMQTYVPQIQQTYVPQTCISHLQHTNCHPIETTTILEKTPTKHIIEKETQVKGKNSQGFEEMIYDLKTQYSTLRKQFNSFTKDDEELELITRLDLCLLLDKSLLKNPQFNNFYLSFSNEISNKSMFFKSRISAIMLKESQIPELLPFKSIEDFNFSSETFFKKNLFMDNKNIKSPFAELNWRSKAKKIVLGFVSKDVWEVLLKNKEFLLEERVILFMVGACEGLKNELGENIMEFEWDEVERVAHTIEKLLVK